MALNCSSKVLTIAPIVFDTSMTVSGASDGDEWLLTTELRLGIKEKAEKYNCSLSISRRAAGLAL